MGSLEWQGAPDTTAADHRAAQRLVDIREWKVALLDVPSTLACSGQRGTTILARDRRCLAHPGSGDPDRVPDGITSA
jgi:hypothetical protein